MRKQMPEMERLSAARKRLLQGRTSSLVQGARVEGDVAERAAASWVDGVTNGADVSGGGGGFLPEDYGAAAVGAGADDELKETETSLDTAW